MTEFVTLEVNGGVATIRLDRPPMNAFSRQVQEELKACAEEATRRSDVRAVVVYGGEKVFAAGADIKEMVGLSYADMAPVARRLSACFGALSEVPKPTVAAITGYALGGGMEVALGCDRRVCGDNAKLGQPEILLGIIPGAGGTQRLPRLVGPAKAKDLIFSGRFVDSTEALAIGLVDEVAPADDVYPAAVALVKRYVGGPAYALRAAKEAIDQGTEVDLATGLEIERMLFAGLFGTRDREIGMIAFVERAEAQFEGK